MRQHGGSSTLWFADADLDLDFTARRVVLPWLSMTLCEGNQAELSVSLELKTFLQLFIAKCFDRGRIALDIQVRALHACVNNALVDHVRRRLLYVLMRRQNQVQRIDVRLGDTRSRRGLAKRYCLIKLQLVGALTVTVIGAGGDLYDVIDRAADRAGHLAVEQLRQPQLSENTWHDHDLHG